MQRRELFPSPLYIARTQGGEQLRAELRERLLAEAAASEGMKVSNVRSWHSEQDLFTRTEPCFRSLTELILGGFRRVLADGAQRAGQAPDPSKRISGIAWAMVMQQGGYSRPHHHGEAHWAGVYYVDAGEDLEPPDGCLSFLDPRGGLNAPDPLGLFHSKHDLKPVDGLLVFFPGWLGHYVHPYTGSRPRVSVACNLQVG
jgi:uncharacterized protein (TIGR02466 family)